MDILSDEEINNYNYNYDLLGNNLIDISDEIEYNIENNTIIINIRIINDSINIRPFELIIPQEYSINEFKYDLETYHIGYENSICCIKHNDIEIDENFKLYNNCEISIYIDNNINIRDVTMPNSYNYFLELLYNQIFNESEEDNIVTKTQEDIDELKLCKISELPLNDVIYSENCSICSELFEKDKTVRILNCKHYFHNECIDKWFLNYSDKCPICKQ